MKKRVDVEVIKVVSCFSTVNYSHLHVYGRIIVQINVSCLPYYQSQLTHQVLKSMCTRRLHSMH